METTPKYSVGDRVVIIATGQETTVLDRFVGPVTEKVVYELYGEDGGYYETQLKPVQS